mmetsp:Transcript_5414/g.10343  ORF Transcript_5414/g.10343 Transcript_5414/m.10343 type:complete len:126 (-) Transcript_5414:1353-1730(-)
MKLSTTSMMGMGAYIAFVLMMSFIPQSHSLIRPQRSFVCTGIGRSRVPERLSQQQGQLPTTGAMIETLNDDVDDSVGRFDLSTVTASNIYGIRGGGPSATDIITSPTFWLSEYMTCKNFYQEMHT